MSLSEIVCANDTSVSETRTVYTHSTGHAYIRASIDCIVDRTILLPILPTIPLGESTVTIASATAALTMTTQSTHRCAGSDNINVVKILNGQKPGVHGVTGFASSHGVGRGRRLDYWCEKHAELRNRSAGKEQSHRQAQEWWQ